MGSSIGLGLGVGEAVGVGVGVGVVPGVAVGTRIGSAPLDELSVVELEGFGSERAQPKVKIRKKVIMAKRKQYFID